MCFSSFILSHLVFSRWCVGAFLMRWQRLVSVFHAWRGARKALVAANAVRLAIALACENEQSHRRVWNRWIRVIRLRAAARHLVNATVRCLQRSALRLMLISAAHNSRTLSSSSSVKGTVVFRWSGNHFQIMVHFLPHLTNLF